MDDNTTGNNTIGMRVRARDVIYISGAMTGLPDLGQGAMDKQERALRHAGYVNIINPYHEVDQTKVITWAEAMRIDIAQILARDVKAMVLLNEWERSKGALLEVILFLALGIPIYNEDWLLVSRGLMEQIEPV